jgi:hypothetical protein
MEARLETADTLEWSRKQPDKSIDLTFCSPPYEAARTYGIGFNLRGQAWVDWAVERFVEHCRITRGLVAWVIEGQTRNYRWSAAPALFMADLHRRGVKLRKPPIYRRIGIPGSGGPDWLRNDYEFIVCASDGRLPWSQNTAMGRPPKFKPGGMPSHRMADGTRVSDPWQKRGRGNNLGGRNRNGEKLKGNGVARPRRVITIAREGMHAGQENTFYSPPVVANPGNVISCVVGSNIGSQLAHENEAPFPEKLAEFFVLSFCPPGGTVYDAFCGSSTTGAVSIKHGRNYIGTDVRESQIELSKRRLAEVQLQLPERA